MTTIKIIDLTSGEEIERELNAEELAQWEIDKATAAAEEQAAAQAASAKAALLERLGITEEEAKLLLGGN